MARKLRIRPSPGSSFMGGLVGLAFVGIGVFVAIPAAGTFGVLWTLIAGAITVSSFYNAFSKRGIASEIAEIDDDGDDATPTRSTEERLQKLDQLRAKGIVTAAEHERRRAEILREI